MFEVRCRRLNGVLLMLHPGTNLAFGSRVMSQLGSFFWYYEESSSYRGFLALRVGLAGDGESDLKLDSKDRN